MGKNTTVHGGRKLNRNKKTVKAHKSNDIIMNDVMFVDIGRISRGKYTLDNKSRFDTKDIIPDKVLLENEFQRIRPSNRYNGKYGIFDPRKVSKTTYKTPKNNNGCKKVHTNPRKEFLYRNIKLEMAIENISE